MVGDGGDLVREWAIGVEGGDALIYLCKRDKGTNFIVYITSDRYLRSSNTIITIS